MMNILSRLDDSQPVDGDITTVQELAHTHEVYYTILHMNMYMYMYGMNVFGLKTRLNSPYYKFLFLFSTPYSIINGITV